MSTVCERLANPHYLRHWADLAMIYRTDMHLKWKTHKKTSAELGLDSATGTCNRKEILCIVNVIVLTQIYSYVASVHAILIYAYIFSGSREFLYTLHTSWLQI